MRVRCVALLLLMFFASAPLYAMGDRDGAGNAPLRAGDPAPDFTLRDLSGQSVSLAALRGKVVFLNFWATWCPPCRAEMPDMVRLNEVFASSDFRMLAINVESDGAPTIPPFPAQSPVNFTILLDADGDVQTRYNVFRFPESFLIDKQGRIVEHFIGGHDWSSRPVLEKVNALIRE